MTKKLDGYELFFKYFNQISNEDMINFGIKNLVSTPSDIALIEWEKIKKLLMTNQKLFIRGYGREAKATPLFIELYKKLFNNQNIIKDGSNNYNPTKCIQKWTKHSKALTKTQASDGFTQIQNFQVSHVFGKTKNPLLFLAPFNIVFIPKVMDPFTGHESKGELTEQFSESLQIYIYDKYKQLLEDYNLFVKNNVLKNLDESIEHVKSNFKNSNYNLSQFELDAKKEWEPIILNNTKTEAA